MMNLLSCIIAAFHYSLIRRHISEILRPSLLGLPLVTTINYCHNCDMLFTGKKLINGHYNVKLQY